MVKVVNPVRKVDVFCAHMVIIGLVAYAIGATKEIMIHISMVAMIWINAQRKASGKTPVYAIVEAMKMSTRSRNVGYVVKVVRIVCYILRT